MRLPPPQPALPQVVINMHDLLDRAPTDSGAMSIPVDQIMVDRCYSTAHREVRRIVRTEKGKFTYTIAGRNIDEVLWSELTTVAVEKFAREVVREVPKPNWTR
jgi:hypothetical protein